MMDIAVAADLIREAHWHDQANAAEQILNKARRFSKREVRDAMSIAGKTEWTVLPGSEPGDFRRFLMVLVDEGLGHNATDKSIHAVLERRVEQARIYVNRINPSTEGVFFALDRSHFAWGGGWRAPAQMHWREVWCRYRAILTQDRPGLRLRVAFLNRVREGRRSCHFDRHGSPAGGRPLLDWWQTAGSPLRELFRERVRLLRHLGVEPDLDCRFFDAVAGEQPEGCNGVPVLDFGATFRGALPGGGLAARLYLAPERDLPVGFPASQYNREIGMPIVWAPDLASIGEPVWRPEDMSHFAQDAGLWLARQVIYPVQADTGKHAPGSRRRAY